MALSWIHTVIWLASSQTLSHNLLTPRITLPTPTRNFNGSLPPFLPLFFFPVQMRKNKQTPAKFSWKISRNQINLIFHQMRIKLCTATWWYGKDSGRHPHWIFASLRLFDDPLQRLNTTQGTNLQETCWKTHSQLSVNISTLCSMTFKVWFWSTGQIGAVWFKPGLFQGIFYGNKTSFSAIFWGFACRVASHRDWCQRPSRHPTCPCSYRRPCLLYGELSFHHLSSWPASCSAANRWGMGSRGEGRHRQKRERQVSWNAFFSLSKSINLPNQRGSQYSWYF